MGISDDISPRKKQPSRRPDAHPKVSTSGEQAAAEKKIDDKATDFFVDKEKSKEAFFPVETLADQPEKKPEPQKTKSRTKSPRHLSSTIYLLAVVVILIIIVLYYFAPIKRHILNLFSGNTNNVSNEDSVKIVPQDYTAPAATTDTSATPTTNTATTQPTATPTTVAAAYDKSALKIEILNGNAVAGAATTMKKTLTTAGFPIAKVSNATHSYTTTYVYYKTGNEAAATDINTIVAKTKSSKTQKSDTLCTTYDIVIVLGKK